jgi:diguanylate cyclase
MAMPNMPSEQMRVTLKELEQALYNHDQWAEMLHTTLICRLTPDQRDIHRDAHRLCRFGQWYTKYKASSALAHHPGFTEIGIEHERMHQYAASLLRATSDGTPISIQDYERFTNALKRLRLEIATVERELEEAIYNLDPLTGTTSRLGMLTKLREEQEFVKRKVRPCTIAMMDLDHFKVVNDTYGHLVGDKVLIAFARYITAHLRPYDKVFRYGGEEFLICMPATDLRDGLALAERLRTELATLRQEADGKEPFYVTVSFGVTLLDPDLRVEASIDRADKALYVAKAQGRNRAIQWAASMNGSADKPAPLETEP